SFMITVAHVREQFLPLSQTFIHQFLRNMRCTRAVAMYAERLNERLFPWDQNCPVAYPSKYSAARASTALLRVTGLKSHANSMTPVYLRELKRLSPDLVHAHFGAEGVKVMDACSRLKIPLVVSFYGYDLSHLTQFPEWRAAYRQLFQSAAALIALSSDFRRRLIDLGCPEEKIRIVHVGVDPKDYPFRPPRTSAQDIRFIGVARLVEKKGTCYALQALSSLRRRMPDVFYTHVGDGELKPEILELAERLDLQDICRFTGELSNRDSDRELAASDVFVLPSVRASNGDEEGTPVTILEAMAGGMPVISTFHSGIPELVEDGVTGFLCRQRDADGLAGTMERIARERGRWEEMGRMARRRIETEYNVRSETARLESLYCQIAGRGSLIPEAPRVRMEPRQPATAI
ncbi:MAG TPA: glycosyltransferase, partial [Chthonomonadales bacterium]|nr:glycosyltransferase [Chthonomonadales bacterium]